MGHGDFLYEAFRKRMKFEPTSCQDGLFASIAEFIAGNEDDILVVNGYAGTGKTSAIASVTAVLRSLNSKCVLLAPTGRAAKVLSSYAGQSE